MSFPAPLMPLRSSILESAWVRTSLFDARGNSIGQKTQRQTLRDGLLLPERRRSFIELDRGGCPARPFGVGKQTYRIRCSTMSGPTSDEAIVEPARLSPAFNALLTASISALPPATAL